MKTELIIVGHEPFWESAARDLFSVVCAFALMLPGWWLDSRLISFTGFLMFCMVIGTRAMGVRKKYTMTIEEAKRRIAEIEAGQ